MIIQFWIWSPRNTRKTPSYPAHFRIAAFGCQRADSPSSFSLELCLQLRIHKLPKLIALCFLAVRVLNSGVERKRASSEHSLSPRSVTRLHVIKTSWSAFGCCRSCGELLPFRLGLHQKPCCPVSPGQDLLLVTLRVLGTSSVGQLILEVSGLLSSQRTVESNPSARTASVYYRDILSLTPKSP